MANLRLVRALSVWAAAAIIAGCGGSQVSTVGALPLDGTQSAQLRTRGASSYSSLLYVSGRNQVAFFGQPGFGSVGSISINNPWALCSDSLGNVWVGNDSGQLFEYAYGSTVQLQEIDTKTTGPVTGCSVDESTGNVAAAGGYDVTVISGGNVASYGDFPFYVLDCAYDPAGDLFAVGSYPGTYKLGLSELKAGGGAFGVISVSKGGTEPTAVQWDGKYIAVNVKLGTKKHAAYRIAVNGSVGTIKQTVKLPDLGNATFWISNGTLYGASRSDRNQIGLWAYPQGGQPQAGPVVQGASFITVATAP